MTMAPAFESADPRTPDARHPLPRLRDVLIEQLRATGVGLRVPLLAAAALGVIGTTFLAFQIADGDFTRKPHSEPSMLPAAIGALLAVAVWAREDRFGPGFLWTLPVDRSRHALLKVLAGWLWLLGGVALFALSQLALALVSGGRVLPVETLHLLDAPLRTRGPIDPALLRPVRWAPGATVWAVPFVSATVTYLLGSAFMLGIRRPLRWVVGAVLLVPVLSVVGHVVGGRRADAPARALALLVDGPYGAESLFTLRTWSLDRRVTLTTGESLHVWSALPDLGDWRIAALLWTGVAVLAVLAAASRHRERRRP